MSKEFLTVYTLMDENEKLTLGTNKIGVARKIWDYRQTELEKLESRLREAEEVISFYYEKKHVDHIQMSPNPECIGAYICIEKFSGQKATGYQSKYKGEK